MTVRDLSIFHLATGASPVDFDNTDTLLSAETVPEAIVELDLKRWHLANFEVTVGAAGVDADYNFDDGGGLTETVTLGNMYKGAVLVQRPYIVLETEFANPAGGDINAFTVNCDFGVPGVEVDSYAVDQSVFTGSDLGTRVPTGTISPIVVDSTATSVITITATAVSAGGVTTKLSQITEGLLKVKASWLVREYDLLIP